MSASATKVAVYCRISKDRAGDEHGVANQLGDAERLAEMRGWAVAHRYCDNDISALSGKLRPDYQAMMLAAERREFSTIIVWQTSRLWRSRRERAHGIEVLRKAGVSVVACKGPSLDMQTAYGRAMAGLLGEFDSLEVEVKGERQQLANRVAAEQGKPRKGTPKPFGWLDDRITAHPAEGPAVGNAARALLSGGTVSGVARDWDKAGIRPAQAPYGPLPARAWSRSSVTTILTNPRIAGISVYKGAEVGIGEWEPLIPEPTFRAIVRLLADPSRQRQQGVRTLLGGMASCQCGNYVTGTRSSRGAHIYRCHPPTRQPGTGPHATIRSGPVDEFIGELVVARLSQPDAASLMESGADKDKITSLRDEAAGIRSRLAALGPEYASGTISIADMTSARQYGDARLEVIGRELADLGRESVLAPLMGDDVRAAWERIGTDRQRAVVAALMTVTLYPAGRGAREFDAEKVVQITPSANP